MRIKLLRELGKISSEEDLVLANGAITIRTHSHLQGSVGLASTAGYLSPPQSDQFLQRQLDALGLTMLDFSGWGNQESILEIHHLENPESLSQHPLVIEIHPGQPNTEELWMLTLPKSLQSEQQPDSGDLQIHLPVLERGAKSEHGTFQFSLYQIPSNPNDGRAQSGRSCKLSFIRIGTEELKRIDDYFNRIKNTIFRT